jgi:hypothetical protein
VPRPLPSGYVLGPDDQILIRALEGLDLGDKPVLIGTNGNITLPLVGRIQAAGLTVEQLETELASRLKAYVKEPQVSVTVTDFRSQPVSVFGAVTTPGVVQLRGRKTLYEVLSMAGGPRETAGSTISIVRLAEERRHPPARCQLRIRPADTPAPSSICSRSSMVRIPPPTSKSSPTMSSPSPREPTAWFTSSATSSVPVRSTLGGQRTISVLSAVSLAGGLGTHRQTRARLDLPPRSRWAEAPGDRRESSGRFS